MKSELILLQRKNLSSYNWSKEKFHNVFCKVRITETNKPENSIIFKLIFFSLQIHNFDYGL